MCERNIDWLPLLHTPHPNQGQSQQPKHLPWLGSDLVTLGFAVWCPTNGTTVVMATFIYYVHTQFSPQKTSCKTFASTLMSTIYQAPQVIRMYIELCKALWQWAASQMIWYKPLWESINTLFLMCWIEDRWIERNMNMRVCFSEL